MSQSIQTTLLPNGLWVVSDTMPTVETVSLGVWVDAGARHEEPAVNGVAHLLEHMAFKGTQRRNARQIAEEMDAVGGHLNAYTSRENTAYYAKVLKEDTSLAMDIIGDILQHSTIDQEELERERTVVVQEISQTLDTPDDIIFDHFQQTAYPDQAMGRSVLGEAGIVREMKRDTLLSFMKRHYGPSHLVISAAGQIDHDRLVAMAEEYFTSLPEDQDRIEEAAVYRGGDFRESRDLEQVHLLFGFNGVAFTDPDFYVLSVLTTLLGGGMSSRLFQEVREKRGLAYSIYSYTVSCRDSGMMAVYAGTGEDEVAELIPVVCDEIRKMTDAIDDAELSRAVAQIKSSLLMSLESTSSRCEQLARQMMIFGRPIPVSETVDKINAVSSAAIRRVAERVFATPLTFAALGPLSKVADFESIERRLKG